MWVRLLVAAGVLAIVVGRLGIGPFLEGIRTTNAWSLALAAGIAVITTACCAWRWTLVAAGLGIGLPLRGAIAAYYRSQFLNTTLPGGVIGDVHRGVRHGQEVADVGRGLRAVAWERSAGQVVQMVLTLVVLILLPSPVTPFLPLAGIALVVAGVGAAVLRRSIPAGGATRLARIWRAAATDLRVALLPRRAWPAIVLASAVVVAGHTATFLIAARAVGCTTSTARLLPIALLVMLAMGLPTNIGGWGPREGMAGWAFGAAGLGATQGVAVSVVYGLMAMVACLPGGFVLVGSWLRRGDARQQAPRRPASATVSPGGVAHG